MCKATAGWRHTIGDPPSSRDIRFREYGSLTRKTRAVVYSRYFILVSCRLAIWTLHIHLWMQNSGSLMPSALFIHTRRLFPPTYFVEARHYLSFRNSREAKNCKVYSKGDKIHLMMFSISSCIRREVYWTFQKNTPELKFELGLKIFYEEAENVMKQDIRSRESL